MKNMILVAAILFSAVSVARQPEQPEEKVISGGQGFELCHAKCVLTSGKGIRAMTFEGAVSVNGYGKTDIQAFNSAAALCRTYFANGITGQDLVVSYNIVGTKPFGNTTIDGLYAKDLVPANFENCAVK